MTADNNGNSALIQVEAFDAPEILERLRREMVLAAPPAPGDFFIDKAAIIPFVWTGGMVRYYLMQPHARYTETKGAPPFQICKGTRLWSKAGLWYDGKGADVEMLQRDYTPEDLLANALREGVEELSLDPARIRRMYDLGVRYYQRVTQNDRKPVYVYAAEMTSCDDFPTIPAGHPTTAAAQWFTREEYATVGRADHAEILREVEEYLHNAWTAPSP